MQKLNPKKQPRQMIVKPAHAKLDKLAKPSNPKAPRKMNMARTLRGVRK